ncbi:MAG TPA: PrgI family protein [Candidatus Paceibacterota bacterium]
MKQFQVPQFIDVEDKILGPITMRQFFIMLIPMGAGILLYFLLKFWLVVIILIPVTIGSAIFAFYRPYGMRFSRFFGAFLAFQMRPRMYIWRRAEKEKVVFTSAPKHKESAVAQPISRGNLKDKRSSVETGSAYRE